MTSEDFKTAITDELRDLPPMPTVVPHVLAEGRRRERRRRWAGAGLAAAAVVGVAAVVPTAFGGNTFGGAADAPSLQATGAGSDRSSTNAASGAADPVTDTKPEFTAWAADRFSEALPERFSPVRPTGNFEFVTRTAGTRIEFNLNITEIDWRQSDFDPGDVDLTPTCASIGGDTCAERPDMAAVAHHETTSDEYAYAGMEMYLGGRSEAADNVALNFFGPRHSGEPVPLTDSEILDLAATSRFEQIWREYTAHPTWVYDEVLMSLDDHTSKSTSDHDLISPNRQR
jgi:hypothetical protein